MTLTLTLDGEGTMDNTTAPKLAAIPAIAKHFKVYPPTEQTKKDEQTKRTAAIHLQPAADRRRGQGISRRAGRVFRRRRPAVRDLADRSDSDQVTKAVRLANSDIVAPGGPWVGSPKEIETQQGGIFANITDPNRLGDDSIRPERWLAGLGGSAAGYVALALVVGRWRRLSGDTAMLRRRAAGGVARRRLREASSHFAAGRTREGADQVLAAALGLVADMLGLPAAGMTSAEACRQLAAAGVAAELVARLRSLLETCEAVRVRRFGRRLQIVGPRRRQSARHTGWRAAEEEKTPAGASHDLAGDRA